MGPAHSPEEREWQTICPYSFTQGASPFFSLDVLSSSFQLHKDVHVSSVIYIE
ncbi:hypothetical protein SAMN04489735_10272 [Aneurinibacillus thermoaerophilus]|uniref:Uncharacterized protein n=1 Tax=Aneurinibacillus thermoaerophilus TaxID=143495 RepID=A0A1G8CPA6_ANETH|nr:hypothetical protein SAMN04489735_10272 [Aneurinibacillus thermoaerophilus]